MNSIIRIASFATLALAVGGLALAAETKAPSPDAVILEGGGTRITVRDFEGAMTRFRDEHQATARSNAETIMKVVDSIFVNRSLANLARKAQIDQDPKIKARIEQLTEAFLATKYLEKIEKDTPIPKLDTRVEEIYKAEPKLSVIPAKVQLNDIVVNFIGRTPEMAKARLLEARALLEKGTPLADVVKAYSDDPQAKRHHGKLGWVQESDVEPAVAAAAFALKPGVWSDVVSTPNGVHLLRVEARQEARKQNFAEMKAALIEAEEVKLRAKASEDFLAKVRNNPENKLNLEVLQQLLLKIDPAEIEKAHEEAMKKMKAEQAR